MTRPTDYDYLRDIYLTLFPIGEEHEQWTPDTLEQIADLVVDWNDRKEEEARE